MPVLFALRLAGTPMPLFSAGAWLVAAMPPFDALNLEPGPDDTGF